MTVISYIEGNQLRGSVAASAEANSCGHNLITWHNGW